MYGHADCDAERRGEFKLCVFTAVLTNQLSQLSVVNIPRSTVAKLRLRGFVVKKRLDGIKG